MATSGLRHQAFIDHGSPSGHIPIVAAVIKARLKEDHRCLYFNSESMVAGLRSHLAEIGVDVDRETMKNSLVFTSHLGHLSDDQTFDVNEMIGTLDDTLVQALRDGFVGLWASGDIAWELGPKRDFGQLLQYEMQLEEFICSHKEMSGICLYDASVLPPDAILTGHVMHPSICISETESRLNPAFKPRPEDVLEVFFSDEFLRRASTCADRQGVTLNEFIREAIIEKLSRADQKDLKNGHV
jgi:MEDS: MEthanogen/methylotroph, DcmR Sensory domain